MFNRKPNFQNQLAAALAENDVWRNLAKVTTDVINEMISEPRWALARIREAEVIQRGDWINTPIGNGQVTLFRRVRSNIDAAANTYDFQDYVEVEVNGQSFATLPVQVLQDRDALVKQAKNLGFNYFSDTLQDDDYARVVMYISKLWKKNGGSSFIDFIGMMKRMKLEMSQLWTQAIGDPGSPSFGTTPANDLDYYADFYPESTYLLKMWDRLDFDSSLTVDQPLPGSYYPTSHVELSWDIADHPTIDKADIVSLFYLLAPIHLVLQRFAETIYVNIDYGAAPAPLLYTIQQRSITLTLDDKVEVGSTIFPTFSTSGSVD